MRPDDLQRLIPVLRPPLETFVRESRARIALLISGAGQVLAQHGFTRSVEIMNVASLAAAAHASSQALAVHAGAGRWAHLYHAGRERQLFLAPVATPAGEYILVVIFGADSSLGIVTLFYEQLERQLGELPELQVRHGTTDQMNFEHDLRAGLSFATSED